ncbi:MAG: LPS-assembly protein LptD [Burkholderia sp.]|jgi:LPS-assembly protein
MLHLHLRRIAAAVVIALAVSAAGAADTHSRVALESVTSLNPARAVPGSGAASFARADRIEGNPQEQLHLIGNAEVRRSGSVLRGDRITYTQATDEVHAQGNARISRMGATFIGPSIRYRLTARTGDMEDADYVYAPRKLRGCGRNVHFLADDHTTMDDAKITTCKREDEAWFVKMNSLEIDEYDQAAYGRGAVLHFMGVPIFASPWLSFPIGNERRSGFLIPSFGMSTTRGIEALIPYYFNLAPNYDLTLTPRIMTKRGAMLMTESRYLYNNFYAQLNFDYLEHDKETSDSRYGTHFVSHYSQGPLYAWIDYRKVSDNDYINDFSGSITESSETVLNQNFGLRWSQKYWNASLLVNKNQTLNVAGIYYYHPYERVPQVKLNGYLGNWNGFEFETNIEATRFKSNTSRRIDGDRFIFKQSVSYPLRGASWFIVPKATWLGTWYNLNNREDFVSQGFTDDSPSRTLPMFSLDAGLVFERDHAKWFGRDTYQTLEPRIYYAYVPYRDQDDIPIFDTYLADLNLATLFNESLFAGYDRVSQANQVSTVLTTKFFDQGSGEELFRASIGQRYYFSDQNVGFPELGVSQNSYIANSLRTDVRSDLLASVGARLTHGLSAEATAQYSTSQSRISKVNAGITWRPRPMSVIGLYYRYNYTTEHQSRYLDDYIKQVDLQMQWPITDRLFALARYNYSLYTHKPLQIIAGFEYLHDCWALRLVSQRYTTTTNSKETNFFLQLELNGLGSIGTSPISELRSNIRGYQSTETVPSTIGQYDYYE